MIFSIFLEVPKCYQLCIGICILFLFVENGHRTHEESIFVLLTFLNGFFLKIGVKNQKQSIANAERWFRAKPMVSSSSMSRNFTFLFKLQWSVPKLRSMPRRERTWFCIGCKYNNLYYVNLVGPCRTTYRVCHKFPYIYFVLAFQLDWKIIKTNVFNGDNSWRLKSRKSNLSSFRLCNTFCRLCPVYNVCSQLSWIYSPLVIVRVVLSSWTLIRRYKTRPNQIFPRTGWAVCIHPIL